MMNYFRSCLPTSFPEPFPRETALGTRLRVHTGFCVQVVCKIFDVFPKCCARLCSIHICYFPAGRSVLLEFLSTGRPELAGRRPYSRPRGQSPPGVLPYMVYIGMRGPKGYGFSAVLVINRVSILANLVISRIWFLHCCLELGIFFWEEASFSSLSIRSSAKAIDKAIDKLCLGQLCQPQRS